VTRPLVRPLAALLPSVAALVASGDIAASVPAPPCTGYIDSLPATITSRGRWCLRANHETEIASGAAITVAANDVTVDCDRYGLSGTWTDETTATGILAVGRDNVRVQRCRVRGFRTGVGLSGARANVEDTVVERSRRFGIDVVGDAGAIRGNVVSHVGNTNGAATSNYGIRAFGTIDVLDNVIRPLDSYYYYEVAIHLQDAPGSLVEGNHVLTDEGSWYVPDSTFGIRVADSPGAIVRGNVIDGAEVGIACDGPQIVAQDNAIGKVTEVAPGCIVRGSVDVVARPRTARGGPGPEVRNCDGYIDAIPATIAASGNYCLRANIGTAIASGVAIHVTAPAVSIDCRGFRVDGSAGGLDSRAYGIRLEGSSAAVRHCRVRGFRTGIAVDHAAAVVVIEDNDVHESAYSGIVTSGDSQTIVRRNRIRGIGSGTASSTYGRRYGIYARVDAIVVDNDVDGVSVSPDVGTMSVEGIYASESVVIGNRVRGIEAAGVGVAAGIRSDDALFVQHNTVADASRGVMCENGPDLVAGNVLMQTTLALQNCADGGNRVVP
jgi:hypothetical protein